MLSNEYWRWDRNYQPKVVERVSLYQTLLNIHEICLLTSPVSGSAKVMIGSYYNANSYAYIYMTQPQLEEGEYATKYTPATSDGGNIISAINLDTEEHNKWCRH